MKRIIIIVVIIIVLAAIAALTLTYFTQRSSNKNNNVNNTNIAGQNNNPNSNVNSSANINAAVNPGNLTVEQIAITYAERYGSYSNQSNFSNLTSLEDFMSVALLKTTENYLAAQPKTVNTNSSYAGVSTTALVTKVLSATADKSEVRVSTQRTEIKDGHERTFYQDLRLKFVKEDGQWKVNEANWLTEGI